MYAIRWLNCETTPPRKAQTFLMDGIRLFATINNGNTVTLDLNGKKRAGKLQRHRAVQ